MARGHAVATVVEQPPGKECLGLGPNLLVVFHLLIELGLDLIEHGSIDDGNLLARKRLALEDHLSNVKVVAE